MILKTIWVPEPLLNYTFKLKTKMYDLLVNLEKKNYQYPEEKKNQEQRIFER